jgi:histidine ammonia-lyase
LSRLADGRPVAFGDDAKARIAACHHYFSAPAPAQDSGPIYGINTGFACSAT